MGTKKHETERIDKQLRGRAGRQGDPGTSRYFISLRDDLMQQYRLDELLSPQLLNIKNDGEIDNSIVRKEINRVQRICDGQNLEIKKTLTRYSDLLEKQRSILFERRQETLYDNTAPDFFRENSPKHFTRLSNKIDQPKLTSICKTIVLYKSDDMWSNFLAEIADIREGIHLKRLGGRDPYIEFQKIAVQLFDELLQNLDVQLIELFKSIKIESDTDLSAMGIKAPAATWTDLIIDNPFEHQLGIQLIGNVGSQIGAGIFGPLLAPQLVLKKRHDKKK